MVKVRVSAKVMIRVGVRVRDQFMVRVSKGFYLP